MLKLTPLIIFDLLTNVQYSNQPIKKIHNFSIYKKTVNHINSQKVPFGILKGPLQITN